MTAYKIDKSKRVTYFLVGEIKNLSNDKIRQNYALNIKL